MLAENVTWILENGISFGWPIMPSRKHNIQVGSYMRSVWLKRKEHFAKNCESRVIVLAVNYWTNIHSIIFLISTL